MDDAVFNMFSAPPAGGKRANRRASNNYGAKTSKKTAAYDEMAQINAANQLAGESIAFDHGNLNNIANPHNSTYLGSYPAGTETPLSVPAPVAVPVPVSAPPAPAPAPAPTSAQRQPVMSPDPYNVYPDPVAAATSDNPAYQTTIGTLKPAGDIQRSGTARTRKTFNDAYAAYVAEPQYDEKNVDINMDMRSTNSKKYIEEQLYSQVLTKPLFTTPVFFQNAFGLGPDSFSVNSLMHLLEIIFSIVLIILCSNSINNDTDISHSVWEYLISAAGILLFISVLFLFRIMNFEHNNGIFYCLIGSGLSMASMGVTIGILLPTECSSSTNDSVCQLRKSETALACVAAILWLINLVQFITVFYISRLNLTPEVQFPINYPPQQTAPTSAYGSRLPSQGASVDPKRMLDPHTLVSSSSIPTKCGAEQGLQEPIERQVNSYGGAPYNGTGENRGASNEQPQVYVLAGKEILPALPQQVKNKTKAEFYA